METKFGKDILNKIKKEDIKKIPKYIFTIKHILIWLFLAISIFIWALSLSINFEYLYNADWFLFHKLWIIKIAITFLPIFWLVFLLFATFLSYYNFKHTEKWYKYSFIKIVWINIFLSIILWIFLYLTWINHFIEWIIEKSLPKYRWVLVQDRDLRMINVWQNEESGLIVWKIIKINNDNNLDFIDNNRKKWIILLSQKTDIKWRINLKSWERIKIMWEIKSDNIFNASQIRPFIWRGMR